MSNKRWKVALPLLFSLVMIAGMWVGNRLTLQTGDGIFSGNARSPVQEAYDLLQSHYVDTLNADSLTLSAVENMMSALDPHSVYLPPVELKEANEELAGNFEGIGVEFNIIKDTVVVTYVIPEGPGSKAGIEPGDRLLKAGDSSLLRKNITADEIKHMIRGPQKTAVRLQLLRQGNTMEKTIVRGQIPLSPLEAAYLIDTGTAYIKLSAFTENSYEEFMKALEDLLQRGAQRLIIDLRGNGGGFMSEATDIADELLDGDKLIVYTEGTHSKKKEYRCRRPGLFEKGKIMVLVDEMSASASEVLAGSLQDWCRATIIGRPTFGKGLVQEQFELSNGAAIRLTVARYFTPLGRCIQRPYGNGKDTYLEEIENRYLHHAEPMVDSQTRAKQRKFVNNCGDTLYGGGGITPHHWVSQQDLDNNNDGAVLLGSKNPVSEFALDYYCTHRSLIHSLGSAEQLLSDSKVASSIAQEWKRYCQRTGLDLSEFSPGLLRQLQEQIAGMIARYRWKNTGYYQLANRHDPYVTTALSLLQ